jgi:hypothetical protein
MKNERNECVRHGPFDVWRTQDDSILMSDLGAPYDSVKDCYALGASIEEATKIARALSENSRGKIITTERVCRRCGARFWPRANRLGSDAQGPVRDRFCDLCARLGSGTELREYWREIGRARGAECVDLSEWCG